MQRLRFFQPLLISRLFYISVVVVSFVFFVSFVFLPFDNFLVRTCVRVATPLNSVIVAFVAGDKRGKQGAITSKVEA